MPFTRKSIRLPAANYVGKRLYFVTICTRDRRPVLSDDRIVESMLRDLSEVSSRHAFAIHAYCFMPDHLHLTCEGLAHGGRLPNVVSGFKQRTAFAHRQLGSLWQGRFYDHVLRRDDAIKDVAWYIWMNPVRKGLCQDPEEFPFSGSLTLPWKQRKRPTRLWSPPWRKIKMPG